MSDSWINIIPTSPEFLPSRHASDRAVERFWAIAPSAEIITAEFSEKKRFIDCGSNLQRVICPECSQEIDLDWWLDQMDAEYEADYPFHPLSLPCCGAKRSIGDLTFDWPQGFARFSIEARNPDIGSLSDAQLSEFAAILGCPVRQILQRV